MPLNCFPDVPNGRILGSWIAYSVKSRFKKTLNQLSLVSFRSLPSATASMAKTVSSIGRSVDPARERLPVVCRYLNVAR